MIESLRIERLAVVDRAQLEFGRGLNVLTGETGAGKSIVLGALSLLAGARASVEAVREGAEEAEVEAVFDTRGLDALEVELAQRGLEGDGHDLVVRRSVARGGRSRAFVSGRRVPVSTLAELFGGLLEVSSQHESHALRQPESHGRLLDAYGGLLETRAEVAEGAAQLRELAEALADLRGEAEQRARREDFLDYQVREIDAAGLVPGEYEALHRERGRRAHAERIGAGVGSALSLLAGDGFDDASAGAADRIGQAVRALDALTGLDPELEPLAARVRGLEAEVRDAAADLERHAEAVELDPARLAELEERLALLERLRRKYGEDEQAILAFRERAAAELDAVTGSEQRVAELEAERERAGKALREAAERLGRGRQKAALELVKEVEAALAGLALEGARFDVALEPVVPPEGLPCGPSGTEAPEFRFAAGAGDTLRPLRRVASGGELSRVFLALKNALRRGERGMVLVFDEVDAGIGGRVADRVGRALADLAARHQVLCITHLPQIAAQADVHFRVAKRSGDEASRTAVELLDRAARVEEIARMAGGAKVGAATRRHARELLRGGPGDGKGADPAGRRPRGEA